MNPEYPVEKPLRAKERTNHKLNQHNIFLSTPGFEPGPHWWEVSAVTTAPLTSAGSPLPPLFDLVPYYHLSWGTAKDYVSISSK